MAVFAGGGVRSTAAPKPVARKPAPRNPQRSSAGRASNARRDASLARRSSPKPKAKSAPRRAAPQPAPKRYSSAPRPSGSGAMSYGGGRSGGVPSAPAAEGPGPIKSAKDWLAGDSTYLSQIANFNKALQDFQANQGLQRSQYTTQYGMDKKSLQDALTQGQTDLEEDFAGRGLLKSGLYTDALGDLNQEFQTQFGQLDTNQKNFMDNLARELANYQTENQMTKNQARADALRRRAAQYGL